MPAPRQVSQGQPAQGQRKGTRYTDLDDGAVSGNLTRDPELRFTPTGQPVAVLRVAEADRVKDADSGEWKDGPASYYDVTAWGLMATNAAECLVRGDRVAAVGKWQRQEWEDKSGNPQSKLVLVARDIGPSLLFREAHVSRDRKGR